MKIDNCSHIVVKVVVHHDLVETWEASFSMKTPVNQLVPGHKIIITEGPELNQEGFIEEIYDDATAFMCIGAKYVSCSNAHTIG